MVSAKCETTKKVWDQRPQWGQGAKPLVRRSGAKPPEAERLFALSQSEESANFS